jgi:Uma2 family endonuclease
MAEAARKENGRATYQDLLEVPEHLVAEIIDGELITSPRPAFPHARASSLLGADLTGPFDRGTGGSGVGPGGWWILDEPELHLGGDVIVPDLAGWRRERMPVLPNVAACQLAPDWVCEIVSPHTARIDRVRKTAIYAREKVAHLWLVDPLAQTLEVLKLENGKWVVLAVHGGAEKIRAEAFDAVELDIQRWWLEPVAEEGK